MPRYVLAPEGGHKNAVKDTPGQVIGGVSVATVTTLGSLQFSGDLRRPCFFAIFPLETWRPTFCKGLLRKVGQPFGKTGQMGPGKLRKLPEPVPFFTHFPPISSHFPSFFFLLGTFSYNNSPIFPHFAPFPPFRPISPHFPPFPPFPPISPISPHFPHFPPFPPFSPISPHFPHFPVACSRLPETQRPLLLETAQACSDPGG